MGTAHLTEAPEGMPEKEHEWRPLPKKATVDTVVRRNIMSRRIRLGKSRKDLATETRIDENIIYQIEHGSVNTTAEQRVIIAQGLSCTVRELYSREQ